MKQHDNILSQDAKLCNDMLDEATYRNQTEKFILYIAVLKDKNLPEDIHRIAAFQMLKGLIRCLHDENLSELTVLYRDKKARNPIGFDPRAVQQFVQKLAEIYGLSKLYQAVSEKTPTSTGGEMTA